MILKDKQNGNYIKNVSPFEKYGDKIINNDIISFYFQINHLKNIYRQGFIKLKFGEEFINKCESVADHSFALGLLSMSIIEKYKLNYDIGKCLKLSLVHELGEIYAGDFTPMDNITSVEKHNIEKEAVEKVLSSLSFENDFLELWEEYENQITSEALFIKELDSLEFLLQAASYELDISYCKLSISKIKTPILKDILSELIILSKNKTKPIVINSKTPIE